MNRLSTFSDNSSRFSISSSPSIARSIPQQQPSAPPDNRFSYLSDNRFSYLSDNRSSYLSENSSYFSISSSPNISLNQQPPPTAPSESYLKYINNRNFDSRQIESKPYYRYRNDY